MASVALPECVGLHVQAFNREDDVLCISEQTRANAVLRPALRLRGGMLSNSKHASSQGDGEARRMGCICLPPGLGGIEACCFERCQSIDSVAFVAD